MKSVPIQPRTSSDSVDGLRIAATISAPAAGAKLGPAASLGANDRALHRGRVEIDTAVTVRERHGAVSRGRMH